MIYFTSDQHHGNLNIIRYEKRPFNSVEEMDEVLIHNWNRIVSPNDTVYNLGDFTFRKNARQYFEKLNGHIKVLDCFWHHDKEWLKQIKKGIPHYSRNNFEIEILRPIEILKLDGKYIVLSHNPFEEWDRKHYGSIHLHGHSHCHSKKIPNRFDVGVDCWNFYPISLNSLDFLEEENG